MHRTSFPRSRVALRTAAVATLLAIVAACSSGPSAAPSATPGPSGSPTAGITLDRLPPNPGCDAMGVEYTSITFRIDPAASPQVWAVTNLNRQLLVRWAASFVGGSADDPGVADGSGQVVARDGDTLEIPKDAWPALHGHFVCPSANELWVFEEAQPD